MRIRRKFAFSIIVSVIGFIIILCVSNFESTGKNTGYIGRFARLDFTSEDLASDQGLRGTKRIKGKPHTNDPISDDTLLPLEEETFLKEGPLNISKTWLKRLRAGTMSNQTHLPKFPVLLTGADRSHYKESIRMLSSVEQNLLPHYPDLQCIYYDLGLSREQRETLDAWKVCAVRNFPYADFPSHARNLHSYAFKPLAINLAFQEFEYVLWLDTAFVIEPTNGSAIMETLRRFEDRNILYCCPRCWQHGSHVFRTRPETFQFMQADPASYLDYAELRAGMFGLRKSRLAQFVIRRWLSCSVVPECIIPKGSKLLCKSLPRKENVTLAHIGTCHRFDQSVISIILWRLFPGPSYERCPDAWLRLVR